MRITKTISEYDMLLRLVGNESKEFLENVFFNATFKEFMRYIAQDIEAAKLNKPHVIQCRIQVYAQELQDNE